MPGRNRLTSALPWAAGLVAAGILGTAAFWVAGDGAGRGGGSVSAGRLSPLGGRTDTTARPPRPGRAVFVAECGACHALAAAGTRGGVGPNLDALEPTAARVRAQVIGGGGGMPEFDGVLSPAEIRAVAAFVAARADRSAVPVVTTTHGGSGGGSGKGSGSSGGSGKSGGSGGSGGGSGSSGGSGRSSGGGGRGSRGSSGSSGSSGGSGSGGSSGGSGKSSGGSGGSGGSSGGSGGSGGSSGGSGGSGGGGSGGGSGGGGGGGSGGGGRDD
ncbi:MAG: cytochrome c [Thermoleophilia bacterium]